MILEPTSLDFQSHSPITHITQVFRLYSQMRYISCPFCIPCTTMIYHCTYHFTRNPNSNTLISLWIFFLSFIINTLAFGRSMHVGLLINYRKNR